MSHPELNLRLGTSYLNQIAAERAERYLQWNVDVHPTERILLGSENPTREVICGGFLRAYKSVCAIFLRDRIFSADEIISHIPSVFSEIA
jgi:hypothetical protein